MIEPNMTAPADRRGGCKLLQKFVAHSGNVNSVAIGRKTSSLIATGGDDKLLNIWQIGKVNCAYKLAGHTTAVEAVGFDGEENSVVGGSASGSLKLWDLATGKIVRTLPGHKANIRSLDFHPFGEFFASGSLDTNLKVWDIRRKGCIQQYKGHTDTINCLRFSPDGRWIVSGSEDKVIKLWDLTAGKMIHEFKAHTGAITSMEFHPNEFLLATASADRTIKFWDLESFKQVSSTDREASRRRVIAFDNDGKKLYSGGQDSLRTYRWEPAAQLNSMAPNWGELSDMCTDRKDGLVATSINQNMVSVWEVTKESILAANGPNTNSVPRSSVLAPQDDGADSFSATTESVGMPSSTTTTVLTPAQAPKDVEDPGEAFAARPKIAGAKLPSAALAAAASRPPRAASAPVSTPRSSPPKASMRLVEESRASEKVLTPIAQIKQSIPSNRGTPVVPAQRDKPLGLNMDAFLPAGAADAMEATPEMDAADIIEGVTTGHSSMLNILALRLRNTRIVRSHWTEGDHKAAVETMLELNDQSVVVDVLNVMKLKPKLWSLDMSNMLMPECTKLIDSQFESHVTTGTATVQMVIKCFGQMVTQNLRSPPAPGGIDISREDRYEKCVLFQTHVKMLRKAMAHRLNTPGKIGSSLRALDKVLAPVC